MPRRPCGGCPTGLPSVCGSHSRESRSLTPQREDGSPPPALGWTLRRGTFLSSHAGARTRGETPWNLCPPTRWNSRAASFERAASTLLSLGRPFAEASWHSSDHPRAKIAPRGQSQCADLTSLGLSKSYLMFLCRGWCGSVD